MSPRRSFDDTAQSARIKGTNLTTVRGMNERLVLHLVRTHGQLTKAEATRLTGLSANAISVIFRALEEDGYLLRGEPIRGRIGQPSVPMRLNPEARYFAGLYVGRRAYRLVIIDFTGTILARLTELHEYPTPETLLEFIDRSLPHALQQAKIDKTQLNSFNIACPEELWSWTDELAISPEEMAAWRTFDTVKEASRLIGIPVAMENDGTAACRAEQVFGNKHEAMDWAYFYVESFIGGGVVLNGSVYLGRRGHAGGFGPLRVPDQPEGNRLLDHASLLTLESMIKTHEQDPITRLYADNPDWETIEEPLEKWITRAGKSLAYAFISALTVIDFEEFVIDGAMPAEVRQRLLDEIEDQWNKLDLQGIDTPAISTGTFGEIAGALGAAAIQISKEYMIDRNQLLQQNNTLIG